MSYTSRYPPTCGKRYTGYLVARSKKIHTWYLVPGTRYEDILNGNCAAYFDQTVQNQSIAYQMRSCGPARRPRCPFRGCWWSLRSAGYLREDSRMSAHPCLYILRTTQAASIHKEDFTRGRKYNEPISVHPKNNQPIRVHHKGGDSCSRFAPRPTLNTRLGLGWRENRAAFSSTLPGSNCDRTEGGAGV